MLIKLKIVKALEFVCTVLLVSFASIFMGTGFFSDPTYCGHGVLNVQSSLEGEVLGTDTVNFSSRKLSFKPCQLALAMNFLPCTSASAWLLSKLG